MGASALGGLNGPDAGLNDAPPPHDSYLDSRRSSFFALSIDQDLKRSRKD